MSWSAEQGTHEAPDPNRVLNRRRPDEKPRTNQGLCGDLRVRTLERWMQLLRREGHIKTEAVPAGLVIRITKVKKSPQFPQALPALPARLRTSLRRIVGLTPAMLLIISMIQEV